MNNFPDNKSQIFRYFVLDSDAICFRKLKYSNYSLTLNAEAFSMR